jgi:hypothetical protein
LFSVAFIVFIFEKSGKVGENIWAPLDLSLILAGLKMWLKHMIPFPVIIDKPSKQGYSSDYFIGACCDQSTTCLMSALIKFWGSFGNNCCVTDLLMITNISEWSGEQIEIQGLCWIQFTLFRPNFAKPYNFRISGLISRYIILGMQTRPTVRDEEEENKMSTKIDALDPVRSGVAVEIKKDTGWK